MILKTFYVTVLSFFAFLIPSVIVEKWNKFKDEDLSFVWQSVLQIIFYSIPIIGLGFLLLLVINLLMSYMMRKREGFKRINLYLLVALIISLLPIFGFVLFDYLQRDRYFEEKNFVSIFFEYSPLLIWVTFAVFLNWRLVLIKIK